MKKVLLLSTATLALAACSAHYDSQNALEHWYNYHAETLSTTQLSDKEALAVFYRPAGFDGEAVNVYVNGDYQVSLLEESFSPVAVCATNNLFTTSYTTNKKFGNRTQGVNYTLEAGQINYIKMVKDAAGNPAFERVSEEVAKADFAQLKGNTLHTLPRVVSKKDCETVVGSKTLSASALWGLDKYTYRDMLPQGKKEVAEFAEFVKANPQISRIEIKGYTDPEASEAYNLALSQRRADTVRQALSKAGVTQTIEAQGYGETHLVVADCAELHKGNPKAKAACNLPNRRVEITTYSK